MASYKVKSGSVTVFSKGERIRYETGDVIPSEQSSNIPAGAFDLLEEVEEEDRNKMKDDPFESMNEAEMLKTLKTFETEMNKVKEKFQGLESQVDNLEQLSTEIKQKHENIYRLSTELEQQHENTSRLFNVIRQQHENTSRLSTEMGQKHENTSKLSTEIEQYYKSANNFLDKIEQQHQEAEKLFKGESSKLNVLTKKIENLLPGATSAGLASSYHKAQQNKKIWPFWIGFLLSLSGLIAGYSYYLVFKETPVEWKTIAIRTTIGLPLLWIAWYCQRSISQLTRIKEEYHHKERVMSMYEGFSKQIDQLSYSEEGKKQKIKLISVLLEAARKNPAEVLDPSSTLLDKEFKKKNGQTYEV